MTQHPEDINNANDTYIEMRQQIDEYKGEVKPPAPAVDPQEIGVSGKGYWLFDRNDYNVTKGEGFKIGPELNTMAKINFTGLVNMKYPWSIYKWIPSHRS